MSNVKPNVVFILADNVGYGDLGSYGGGELRGAPTPRLDQLAREGLRLTQFLVEPACTPSRAALMTGQYSIRNGLSLICVPGSNFTLSASAVTLGELLATWGAHDLTHLHQISRILAYPYQEQVGPWRKFLGVMGCAGHSAAA